jgi:hypothetical protein
MADTGVCYKAMEIFKENNIHIFLKIYLLDENWAGRG